MTGRTMGPQGESNSGSQKGFIIVFRVAGGTKSISRGLKGVSAGFMWFTLLLEKVSGGPGSFKYSKHVP